MKLSLLPILFFPLLACGAAHAQEPANTQVVDAAWGGLPVVMTSYQGTYSYDTAHHSHEITFDGAYNGTTFYLKIPRGLPAMVPTQESLEAYPGYQVEMDIIADRGDGEAVRYETDCFVTYAVPSAGASFIMAAYGHILAVEVEESAPRHVQPACHGAYDAVARAGGLAGCDSERVPQLNIMLREVCVYPESVPVLFARGYLL